MNGPVFVLRLALLQAAVPILAAIFMLTVAPRALFVEQRGAAPGETAMLLGTFLVVVVQAIVTAVLVRPALRTLRALASRSREPAAADLARVDVLPARLVMLLMGLAVVDATVRLVPAVEGFTPDAIASAPYVLFQLAVVASAALPLYVLLRGTVARVIEATPPRVAAEALDTEESRARGLSRVRTRFLVGVFAPVAFIGLTTSLLAFAHTAASAAAADRATATMLAEAVLEPVAGSRAGREEAISAAAAFGVRVMSGAEALAPASGAAVRVPASTGELLVVVPPRPLLGRVATYGGLLAAALAVVGLIGLRVGALYSADLAAARRVIDQTGTELATEARAAASPRFSSVATLLEAVSELGYRFREFALAHEQATMGKEGTERMRALFLATMSHDLKSPLNSILGFAALLDREPLTTEQRESLAIIEQRGRELLRLIDVILDASRADAGQLEVTLHPSRLDDVVMAAVLDARELAKGLEVDIRVEVQPGAPLVSVDAERMVQALVGVIGTAVRYTDKSDVTVRAVYGPGVTVAVETEGRGLHPAEREQLFEAFKHPDRARRLGSLGLELSLARAVVELHRGVIDVDVPPDGGIAFRVRIPMSEDEPPSESRLIARPSMMTRPDF